MPIIEVRELIPADDSGVEVIADLRVLDMRRWKSTSRNAPGIESSLYGYRRIRLRKLESTANRFIVLFRMDNPRLDVRSLNPGNIVVMDDLRSHKQIGVIDAIEGAGAHVFYFPPYSPNLNPIEQVFSKLKSSLKRYCERTREELWNRIGTLNDTFTPEECANLFRHCGYSENHS